jgi:hypothetical protein
MKFDSRPGVLILAIALILPLVGCGGGKSVKGDSFGNVVGANVRFEGTLVMRGSQPFPQLVLEMSDGRVVRIESETLLPELKSLTSMRVSLEGEVLPEAKKPKMPVVNALRYRLVRLPSGEQPLLGTLTIIGNDCILTARDGRRYWMRGDLVPVLREYRGERLWVVGSKGAAGQDKVPDNTTPYWVTGYGVLGQPAAGM